MDTANHWCLRSQVTAGDYSRVSAQPLISVVMAAYNAEHFVAEAISSLLRQTFKDFELLVVNDGSTDRTGEVIAGQAGQDSRVRLISQANAGLANARNTAIAHARAEFIAVADADDVQLPERLETLMGAFVKDPGLTVCGGGVDVWSGEEKATANSLLMPATDAEIRAGMPFESMLFDPSVMFRRKVLAAPINGYDPAFRMAVDYDLWSRLMPRQRFGNCQRVLTRYRRHPAQLTQVEGRSRRSITERQWIWKRLAKSSFGIDPRDEDLHANELAASWPNRLERAERDAVGCWLERLWEANHRLQAFPERAFAGQVARRWLWSCSHSAHLGLDSWRSFHRSPLSLVAPIATRPTLGLLWRCLRRMH
jgi:glycosyltransferase involved in cell wall biosynthesis